MSRARDFADLAGSADAGGLTGRNLIINGAMQVAQRGTSTTSTSDGYHTVDRLYLETNQLDNYAHTMSQSTEAPDGFANSFKIDVTTAETAIAAGEFLRVLYRIEAQDCQQLAFGTSSAQRTTLSFYVRSAVTGTYAVSMYQFDGNRIIGGTYTIDSADTWERKTITFDGDTSGVINDDNGAGLQLSFMLSSGSDYTSGDNTSWSAYTAAKLAYGHTANVAGSTSNDWHITGVQLELGEQATPFEHRSFGDELARCQRYYEHTYPYGTAPGTANGGIGADHRYVGRETPSNYGYYTGHYRVEKRAAATVTVYSYAGTANQIAHGDTGSDSGAVGVIQSGTTSFLPRNTSGSGVSARVLMYHFKADAEL